jgi:predicted transcriptional regulator
MALSAAYQIRAARAAVRMEQERLAATAGVSVNTVKRIEATDGTIPARLDTMRTLQRALEATGVEFVPGGLRVHDREAKRFGEAGDTAPKAW